jgi:purine nucleoside permease
MIQVRRLLAGLASACAVLVAAAALPRLRADPIPVKVAVVVTFEVGADTGDTPGEFQHWAEREKWPQRIVVPGVDHPVLTDGKGVIGVVAGATGRAATQVMALVLSGMFDFSKTYWLINGIAGVDPADASIGSAAWARYVIDGDVAYEIDPREGDPSWPYGIMPIGSKAPNTRPKREGWEPDTMAYELNPALVAWAYGLTKAVAIPDTPAMADYRALYVGFPNAQRPPFVLLGETFGCNRYWHGRAMTQWANDWTRLWTDGKGNFVMTDMEDQGFAAALRRLSGMGRVDFQRVLFLRTASNYCMQPPGMEANKSLHNEMSGYLPSLEAAYRVGSVVVHELAGGWDKYRDATPSP